MIILKVFLYEEIRTVQQKFKFQYANTLRKAVRFLYFFKFSFKFQYDNTLSQHLQQQ